ncbi:MAG: NAD(P)/FAD-dependent oxidoreductase [Candidatus Omnitrophica bacterium]|nr:NAD(P)/FAD-dependent oxidoreductase [Candidatus Omnitrophota bacterium]
MEEFDVIIVGAGPSGMMAAIGAAQRKRKVLLIERNSSPGKKLLISGNSRCNLTNSCEIREFLDKFSASGNFLRNAFAKFFNTELVSFFENSNLKLKVENDGRIFPKTDQAGDVLGALKTRLKNRNIKIIFNQRVKKVLLRDGSVRGVLTNSNNSFSARKVVIATGGLSYPLTGSSGDGYRMAEELGHEIIVLKPALVPVRIKEKFIRAWQGIAFKNVRLTLFSGKKEMSHRFGEMLFTHFGISGPIVLDLSADIYDALRSADKVTLGINFKPTLDNKKLDAMFLSEFSTSPKKTIKNIFKNLLPNKVIDGFFQYCCLDAGKTASQITAEERKRMVKGLSDLRLTVTGVMPLKDGVVTRGGVNTKEINPKTMESKLISGLYFAGEMIDIDAGTGGYNMQAAFSTGWVCGNSL